MKEYTKETLIAAIQDIRKMGWIENRRPGNDGGVGNTLEDLLGVTENNLPIPNAAEWELKTQRMDTSSLATLFHMEPSPTAYKFVPQILLPHYGWPHQKAGKKYPACEMSFRQTIRVGKYSDRGFTIILDRENGKVCVSFNADTVDEKHEEWKQNVEQQAGLAELSPQPYWGFDDLFYKVGTKLHNCFFIRAERKKEGSKEYFLYKEILVLRKLSQDRFIEAIAQGDVYIDFDARTGHNHGTKFRIRPNIIPHLYTERQDL